MTAHRFGLICFCVLLAVPAPCLETKDWRLCVDKEDGVSFRYPSQWQHGAAYSDRTEFDGPGGMVQIFASEGESPQIVCHGGATHKLRPFGQHPRIRSMKVQGQRACLVWPSNDQGAPHDAEVVIQYPHPVIIGGDSYPQLVVDGDKNHILAIIDSLRFISAKNK